MRSLLKSELKGQLRLVLHIAVLLMFAVQMGCVKHKDPGGEGEKRRERAEFGNVETPELDDPLPHGVVVLKLKENTALWKAGLRPGHILSSWQRIASPPANSESAQGAFDSPFDWAHVALEQAHRGTVVLRGSSNTGVREWRIDPGDWKRVRVRPRWPQVWDESYAATLESFDSGQVEIGVAQSPRVSQVHTRETQRQRSTLA